MKIDPYEGIGLPKRSERSGDAEESNRRPESRGAEEGDRIQLSAEARLRSSLASAADRAPETRQARVDALRQKVSEGSYRPDPRLVAGAILEFEDGLPG